MCSMKFRFSEKTTKILLFVFDITYLQEDSARQLLVALSEYMNLKKNVELCFVTCHKNKIDI